MIATTLVLSLCLNIFSICYCFVTVPRILNKLKVRSNSAEEKLNLIAKISSHDLREPFTTILSFIEAIEMDITLKQEEKAFIRQRIQANARRGLELSENILRIIKPKMDGPKNL